jgi:hypothetical protein
MTTKPDGGNDATQLERVRGEKLKAKKKSGDFTEDDSDDAA